MNIAHYILINHQQAHYKLAVMEIIFSLYSMYKQKQSDIAVMILNTASDKVSSVTHFWG